MLQVGDAVLSGTSKGFFATELEKLRAESDVIASPHKALRAGIANLRAKSLKAKKATLTHTMPSASRFSLASFRNTRNREHVMSLPDSDDDTPVGLTRAMLHATRRPPGWGISPLY